MNDVVLWDRFQKYLLVCENLGISLDISRMNFGDNFFTERDGDIRRAFAAMDALEAGAIANPDEKRMVGHYWLRDSARAPTPELKREIDSCFAAIKKFARAVHTGKIKPPRAQRFKNLLLIGIGGSALGPQFVAKALGSAKTDKLKPYFFDNTDPQGMDDVLAQIGPTLRETLVIVVSKSGGTKETRNGMLEAKRAFEAAKLKFEAHAVAVTQVGSELDKVAVGPPSPPRGEGGALAPGEGAARRATPSSRARFAHVGLLPTGEKEAWLARFPMWDWVGGRTSELSAVGLLPAALQGIDIQAMLAGAKAMDELTRAKEPLKNPAAVLALMWFHATGGQGRKDMVILPYKDRLELFSKYLQQLVMESLGKEKDLDGKIVNQGIAVYGNKGSTDQHAYVQQLREGVPNFFATFIEVLKDREGQTMFVEEGATSGDYLSGFYQGTRQALYEKGRESMTITVPDVSARTVGALIALYERAVGFYATLVNINAYHQPGVEAGKKAAGVVLALQQKIVADLKAHKGESFTAARVAEHIGAQAEVETVFKILRHLAANKRVKAKAGAGVVETKYGA